MCRYLPLLLFIGLAWGQTTIAVFEFENNGLEPHEVRQLSTRLESELVKVGGFKVVERNKIDEILKEQKLQISGCVEECLIDVGKMLGAKQIVLGSVGKIDGLFTISAKLVDAETGESIRSSDFDADNGLSDLLKNGLRKVAYELTDKGLPSNNDKNFSIDFYPKTDDEIDEYLSKNLGSKITFIPYEYPPEPIEQITPIYPQNLIKAGLEGSTVVGAFIDYKGKVKETIILKSSSYREFDNAAMESIQRVSFKPAKHKGEDVGVWIHIPINFKLD